MFHIYFFSKIQVYRHLSSVKIYRIFSQTVDLSNGLTLNEAEGAITTIAAVHALTLGMKLKEKVDLNEKYPVSEMM